MRKSIWILLLGLFVSVALAEEAPVIGEPLKEAGTRLELPDGNLLQVAIEDRNLVAYFVDSEGLLIESPANSIVFVVDQPGNRNDEWRTVIKPVDPAKLSSVRALTPPYKFKTRMIIRFKDGSTRTLANAFVELDKE